MRYLLLALLAVGLAGPGWAANTVDWRSATGGLVANSINQGQCRVVRFTAVTNESRLLFVGGLTLAMFMTPDTDGSGGACSVDLFACSTTDGDRNGTADVFACDPYKWDTDGDGIVDNSALDGATDMKRGLQEVGISGWLYVDPSLVADECELVVCAVQ